MSKPTGKIVSVLAAGPLGPFADAYRERLTGRGYAPVTTAKHVIHLGHLSRWLEVHGMGPADLTRERLGQFVAARQALVGHRACSVQGLLPVLEILEERGVVSAQRLPQPVSAAETIAGSFGCYLAAERGASVSTVDAYVPRARRFVAAYAPGGDLGTLTPAIVTRAVLAESAAVSAASAQVFVKALRAFLHFCFVEGLTGTDLAAAALMMPTGRRSCLPRGISSSDAGCLLRSCDRRTAGGRRDYAVILTLLRMGLRAGEVAGLRLDDIDWRPGELVVRGKAGRADRLPLVAEVGEAIAAYLRHGRPATTRREVFLRALAPVAALGRGGVSDIVLRACARAGIAPVRAHRLRHTVACEMVATGVPLPDISEVLRHSGRWSTATYARVDVRQLRQLALPWPGGERQ
jgi:site-specific recombinase XerD